MPAQEGRLTPEQINVLASYVWRFSNMPTPENTPAVKVPPVKTAAVDTAKSSELVSK
jgi:hypothetical protein